MRLPAPQVLLRRAVERHHRPRGRRGQRVVPARRAAAAARARRVVPGCSGGPRVWEAVHGRARVGEAVGGAAGGLRARRVGGVAARVPAHGGVGNGVPAARRAGRRRHHEHVLKQENSLYTQHTLRARICL